VLIDTSNPLDFTHGMPPTLFVKDTDSLGEQIQREFPAARVVKTLNTMTAAVQAEPGQLAGGDHSVFVSGNDAQAKLEVTDLLKSMGHTDVIDLGDITTARGPEMYLPPGCGRGARWARASSTSTSDAGRGLSHPAATAAALTSRVAHPAPWADVTGRSPVPRGRDEWGTRGAELIHAREADGRATARRGRTPSGHCRDPDSPLDSLWIGGVGFVYSTAEPLS